jgi:hypothetical protein
MWVAILALGLAGTAFGLSKVISSPYTGVLSEACDGLHQMVAGVRQHDGDQLSEGYDHYIGPWQDLDQQSGSTPDNRDDSQVIATAIDTYANAHMGDAGPLSTSQQANVNHGLQTCEDY